MKLNKLRELAIAALLALFSGAILADGDLPVQKFAPAEGANIDFDVHRQAQSNKIVMRDGNITVTVICWAGQMNVFIEAKGPGQFHWQDLPADLCPVNAWETKAVRK